MLVITSKKYEVDEEIIFKNENGDIIFQFQMQITADDLKRIQDIILDSKLVELNKKLGKMVAKNEDTEELEKQILKITENNQEEFENICFKDNKELCKQTVGEYKYLEMVEVMFDFFWTSFISKRTKQVNTMISDLRKIGGK